MLYIKPANYEDIEKEWLFQRSIPADENAANLLASDNLLEITQVEVMTGKVIGSDDNMTEEMMQGLRERAEAESNLPPLEKSFLQQVISAYGPFRSCDFTECRFVDEEYRDILGRMGNKIE